MNKVFAMVAFAATLIVSALHAQAAASTNDADLKFVVYFSRHGVRSPTGKAAQYDSYSSAAWPSWAVAPGLLTPHGYHLMELFGAYDRLVLRRQGLFTANICEDADHATFYADSDQRTRETGKALAASIFPGCNAKVSPLPEGTSDALFHLPVDGLTRANSTLAIAAIAGRMGGDPANVTQAYRTQLQAFDTLLGTCGKGDAPTAKRASLLEIPAILVGGGGDHLAELRGPINTASTLSENLLLEYVEGMPDAQVGWGCVDGARVRSLIDIHTAASDFAQRTPAVAKEQSANLLNHIREAIGQAVKQEAVPGALSKTTDRALFLIGHDTNIINMAGALKLTWIADGRRDDTAPGSTLIFELWKNHASGEYSVRLYLTVQTLEQMRFAKPLTEACPPTRVSIFIPGCSRTDLSCSWPSFARTLEDAIR